MIRTIDPSAIAVLWMVVVPALIALGVWSQRRRAKAVRAWATAAGWQYLGTDASLTTRWRGRPFGAGHSRRTSDVMVGTLDGRPVMSFTYSYRSGSGKDESTFYYHVLATALPAFLPTLELTPEHLGARIARAFGGQDIEFESEDFNRAWRVQAGVVKFAHDVLHPRLMQRLLDADARFSMRIEGTDILAWEEGMTDVRRIAPRLQVLGAVVDAIPRFVWLDHGYDPGYVPDADAPRRARAEAGWFGSAYVGSAAAGVPEPPAAAPPEPGPRPAAPPKPGALPSRATEQVPDSPYRPPEP